MRIQTESKQVEPLKKSIFIHLTKPKIRQTYRTSYFKNNVVSIVKVNGQSLVFQEMVDFRLKL